MKTVLRPHPNQGKARLVLLIVTAAALAIAGWYFFIPAADAKPTDPDRAEIAQRVLRESSLDPTWPKTEQAAASAFWEAAAKRDYATLTKLCPGSVESDFKTHYDQFAPGPVTSIGAPEPHPVVKSVMLYPVILSFPGYPKKTIKMAFLKTQDGRVTIDGQHTIWW